MSASMICKNRSIPVMPRWNCSANSIILRIVAISVVTYKRNATRSPAATHPFIINMLPKSKTDTYIAPSKAWVVALKTAIR